MRMPYGFDLTPTGSLEIKENKVVQLFESHAEALLSKEIY